MADFELDINGIAEMQAKLALFAGDVQESVLDKMVDAGCRVVEKYAKINARVDTGFMRNAIYVTTRVSSTWRKSVKQASKRNGQASGFAQRPAPAEAGTGYVTVGAEYAQYVEDRYPFLRPAIDEHGDEITRAMSAQLETALKKAFG